MGGDYLSLAWRSKKRFWQVVQDVHFLPLTGILTGGVGGAAFMASYALTHGKALSVVIALLAITIATRGIYEANLIRFFELFVSGPTGVVALVFALLVKYQALMLVPARLVPSVMISAIAFSRYAAGSFVFTHSRIIRQGHHTAKLPPRPTLDTRRYLMMTFLGMIPLLATGSLLLLLFVPLLWLLRNIFGMWFIRRQGGYTADSLGATQQIVETAFYVLVVIACLHPLIIG